MTVPFSVRIFRYVPRQMVSNTNSSPAHIGSLCTQTDVTATYVHCFSNYIIYNGNIVHDVNMVDYATIGSLYVAVSK